MKFYLDFEACQYSNKVIAIGCVCENGETYKTYVKLPKGHKVGKEVSELTGITDEMLEDAPIADEAFKALYHWCLVQSEEAHMFYTFGNSDVAFVKNTVKHMNDFTAIVFATFLINSMEDYSKQVTKHYGVCLGLNKVYNIMNNINNIQRHDPLEDAQMLQYIEQNLAESSTEIPEEYRTKSAAKKAKGGNMPDTKELAERKFYLGLLKKWNGKRRHQAKTDGTGSSHKYLVYHKDSKVECRTYYFTTFENMLAWFFCFNIDGKSIKAEADRNEVKNIIEKAIKDKEVAYNYRIELDEVE